MVITVKNTKIALNFEPQQDINGRKFRYIGFEMPTVQKTIYSFLYIDNNELLKLEFINNKFKQRLK